MSAELCRRHVERRILLRGPPLGEIALTRLATFWAVAVLVVDATGEVVIG
jgi:hypothetical protein